MTDGGEFGIIRRYFTALGADREDVVLGVGDDAALLDAGAAASLRVTCCSRQADPGVEPGLLAGHCVDEVIGSLAALGATPAWLTLALSLERDDERWIAAFADGLNRACARHGVCVVGGDTTSGTGAVTLFAIGWPTPGDPA